jgi:hypothetical protein
MNYGFYWDDYHIARPWSWQQLGAVWFGTWDPLQLEPEYYRPLTALSFASDYALWNFNALGYHLTNFLLELGVALGGYWLLCKAGVKPLVALVGVIFLLILPSSTATTIWISERSDSLALCFMLISLLCFIKVWQGQASFKLTFYSFYPFYLVANLALLLGLASKETCVIVVPIWLLYSWIYTPQRSSWKQWLLFIPPLLLTGLYLLLHALVIHNESQYALTIETLWKGYTQAVLQSFYGLDGLINTNSYLANSVLVILLLGLLLTYLVWRGRSLFIKTKLNTKPTTNWQLLFLGLGWVLVSCLPLALLATSYGIDQRVLYTPGFGYTVIVSACLSGGYNFIKNAVGSWRFWPLVAAGLVGLWLIYSPLSKENLSIQKQYGPLASEVLCRDTWILQTPAWVQQIPPAQIDFIEQKLKLVEPLNCR